MTQQSVREIVFQILEALKSFHAQGRIHKDLKLENAQSSGAVLRPCTASSLRVTRRTKRRGGFGFEASKSSVAIMLQILYAKLTLNETTLQSCQMVHPSINGDEKEENPIVQRSLLRRVVASHPHFIIVGPRSAIGEGVQLQYVSDGDPELDCCYVSLENVVLLLRVRGAGPVQCRGSLRALGDRQGKKSCYLSSEKGRKVSRYCSGFKGAVVTEWATHVMKVNII